MVEFPSWSRFLKNLSIKSLVIHGFSTTFMYNIDFDWQLSHLELKKKSPDIVFKFETANWWRLLLTLTYGHAGTRGAKPAHPSPFLPSFSISQGSSLNMQQQRRGCSIHFCCLKAKREVKYSRLVEILQVSAQKMRCHAVASSIPQKKFQEAKQKKKKKKFWSHVTSHLQFREAAESS